MKIVGVGAAFCIGCCPNIRNGTAIAAPAVWVSPPMAHDVRATSCKQPIDVVFQRRSPNDMEPGRQTVFGAF